MKSIEDRLAVLERAALKPVQPGIITSSYIAQEFQTLIISATGDTLNISLPQATPRNKEAWIRIISINSNPITFTCRDGFVNQSSSVTLQRICSFFAVSDGLTGWYLSAVLPSDLRGPGFTVTSTGKLGVRSRPRYIKLQDWFRGGNTTSGSIGSLGWNLLGTGTPAITRGSPTVWGSSNCITITTTAGGTDRTSLCLGETETRDIGIVSETQIMQCVWNHDNALANKRIFFGYLDTMANEPSAATNCFGIYYDAGVGANYQIISRSGGSGSPVDTGIATPAQTAELITIHQSSSGVFKFYTGATLLGTISSGIPTAAMNVGFRMQNLTTTARNTNIGYFGLEATADNSMDDDSFLEA